jgi:hypothetical protein
MQWGTGYRAAVDRMQTLSAQWLVEHEISAEMMDEWQVFYRGVF